MKASSPLVVLVILASLSVLLVDGVGRTLCIARKADSTFTFAGAGLLDLIRHCNIIYGDVHIWNSEFDDDFRPLSNLTDLLGELKLFANDGPRSLGHLFPNLAAIRLPDNSEKSKIAIYVSNMPDLQQINLTKLAYLNGTVKFLTEQLCYASTVNWFNLAPTLYLGQHISAAFKYSKNTCYDTCPVDCPWWPDPKRQYCWSADTCQLKCEENCEYCNPENPSQCCHPTCLGGCTGPTALDCSSCRDLMVVDTGACLLPNVKNCPHQTLKLFGRFCVSKAFCKAENYKIHNGQCLAECPIDTNDHQTDKYSCISCHDETCRRIEINNRTIMYPNDFPSESFTDIVGNLVVNLEGSSIKSVKDGLEKFNKLRNLTGPLKIYRCERIQHLDNFEALQEIGSGGCRMGNGFCLTIHSNEFLQRLWTPKKGKLVIANGNVSIAHNPRLCQSEIDRFRNYLIFLAPHGTIISEGNGDRGYCGSMPIKPLLVVSQHSEKDPRATDSNRSIWQIVPTVAFNLSNTDQLLTLFVYHQKIDSNQVELNLTYYDPAYCDANDNAWKRHVINVANYSNPDHWQKVNGRTLFIANVSTPQPLYPNQDYALYALAQYLDGKIAISEIVKFKTVSATPCWGMKQIPTVGRKRGWNFMEIRWELPRFPNGNVTHYLVRYWKDENVPTATHQNCQVRSRPLAMTTPIPTLLGGHPDLTSTMQDDLLENYEEIEEIHRSLIEGLQKNPKNFHDYDEDVANTTKLPGVDWRNYERIEESQRNLIEGLLNNPNDENTTWPGFVLRKRKKRNVFVDLVSGHQDTELGGEMLFFPTEVKRTDCYEIRQKVIAHNLTGLLDMKKRPESETDIVCGQAIEIEGLQHFTSYKFEVRACLSPNLTSDKPYLCSTPVMVIGRTLPHPDADKITYESFSADANTEVKGSRTNRRIFIQRPNMTNGPILAFEVEYRGSGSQDHWMSQCIDYDDDGHSPMEFLLSLYDPQYELRVRLVTAGGVSQFSPIYIVEGVVSRATLIMGLSIGLTLVLLLVSAGIITWYIFVLRKTRKLEKEGQPTWISVNPDYPLLSAIDIPSHMELERDDLEVLAEIGHGAFGVVYKGIHKPSGPANEKRPRSQVAIKSLRCDATLRQKHEFLHEALLLAGLECHHIVRMVGVVSKSQPVYVVMELMDNADLKSFLVKQRNENTTVAKQLSVSVPSGSSSKLATLGSLTMIDFSQMAGEIADGMAYLAARKIVHRDLAARNCLVARDRTVKIGDFGLARDIYDEAIYKVDGKGFLPVRWMAPESLRDGIFDTNSDVWSYGVLLWEIVTYGEQPYQGKSNMEVVESVKQHRQVLNKPKNCPDKFYNLMLRCWQYRPNERLSFVDIVRELLPSLPPDFLRLSYFGTLSAEEAAPQPEAPGLSKSNEINDHDDEDDEATTFLSNDTKSTTLTPSVKTNFKRSNNNNNNNNNNNKNSGSLAKTIESDKAVANVYNIVGLQSTTARPNVDVNKHYAAILHNP